MAATSPAVDPDVIVVGAGLAGLACAIHLHEAGRSVVLVEASDGVGGRVRTDLVDGFTLDRGFQVLLTAYPEARRMLDYTSLDLRRFEPGALVQLGAERHLVSDPFRSPTKVLASAKAPVGSLQDKARVAWLRHNVMRESIDELWARPEMSTIDHLRASKFSPEMIERFFRPLFSGIQLDPTLTTSSRMFEFIFKMLAEGDNAIPARGMCAISDQLAGRLDGATIRLKTPVASLVDGGVTLASGETLRAASVVVACDGPHAATLLGESLRAPASNSVACLYFATDRAPFTERMILLNGDGASSGPINNVCVPSNISPNLAPGGAHLVSASIVGRGAMEPEATLLAAARTQLRSWFGADVDKWVHLRTYQIEHAQPAQPVASLSPVQRPVKVRDGLYVCGDHRDTASIHGALLSGRRAADAIITG